LVAEESECCHVGSVDLASSIGEGASPHHSRVFFSTADLFE
jgi:hypothetical protein